MNYAIVYSSKTGNTKLLAETIRDVLPGENCIYCGAPSEAALQADRIYVGFWTNQGVCDQETAQFLQSVTDQELYLFGTAGFGESPEYFDKVLERTMEPISKDARVVGHFMCQGKMPMSVRQRYEKMMEGPAKIPNLQGMIDNFDKALSHPDQGDLDALRKAIQSAN